MRVSKVPEERKSEIITIAKKLFFEKGFSKVSIREIVRETDSSGSPGLFYYYFESKQDIYEATVNQIVSDELQIRNKIVTKGLESNKNLETIILDLLQTIEQNSKDYYQIGLVNPENEQLLEKVSNRLIQEESKLFLKLLDAKTSEISYKTGLKLSSEERTNIVNFVLYGANGVLRNAKSQGQRKDAINLIATTTKLLLGLE